MSCARLKLSWPRTKVASGASFRFGVQGTGPERACEDAQAPMLPRR
eukprot:CAMPEP_0115748632 /NCGR_PEP_ID=MMETSP0272-20121206/93772_1 /TAXON_ID=71861 /ORGANISM="Scrippsiella trochoidea, Strain CCMP3099" /LENGTH=45 /DNA_ID= /DNA_START= /DNA_END= /DNA_ORIENTATION=